MVHNWSLFVQIRVGDYIEWKQSGLKSISSVFCFFFLFLACGLEERRETRPKNPKNLRRIVTHIRCNPQSHLGSPLWQLPCCHRRILDSVLQRPVRQHERTLSLKQKHRDAHLTPNLARLQRVNPSHGMELGVCRAMRGHRAM